MRRTSVLGGCAGLLAVAVCVGADGSWMKKVPEAYRKRTNPYAGEAEAIAAGMRVFVVNCA